MAQIDLKPLNKETINKMGWTNHDLWMVKIENEVFGPFETESLKQYSADFEEQFDKAVASRVENNDFRPFWSFALFQRKSPLEPVIEIPHWLMHQGQKAGPFTAKDIDKRIEMGTLALTDHVSTDDGHSWKKISELPGFQDRVLSADELPSVPDEPSFRRAKLLLQAKIEQDHPNAQNDIANLAFLGQQKDKTSTIKLDDLTLQNLTSTTEVSESLKWAIPAGFAIVIALGSTGYYIFSPSTSDDVAYENEAEKPEKRRIVMPSKVSGSPSRTPASNPPAYVAPTVYPSAESRYKTYTETHMNELPEDRDREKEKVEKDPRDVHAADAPHTEEEGSEGKEHNLVQGTATNEEQTLDAAMNSDQPPAEPVVEEATDL